ncbi:MAG: heavy-metal-associated domain-containing protein [Deltaproteobacteria bacterium]|nr:heavy-metal-associated domain-containing protein [Deltaproteobacteria bacterium]
MNRTTFSIPNISCNHCINTISKELAGIDGVSNVEGDSITKEIVVRWDTPATLDVIEATLAEINYPAKD